MPYRLNEGVSTSVLDLVQTAAKKGMEISDDYNKNRNTRNGTRLTSSSIMTAGKDLVMSFPVLCDNTISPSTAGMVTKAIERMCVAQLQLLFASANLKGGSGQEVLRKFHHNMNQQYGMDDFLDFSDALTGTGDNGGSYDIFDRLMGEAATNMRDQFLNDLKFYPVSSFSESSINDYTVDERFGDRLVSKTPMKSIREDKSFRDYQKDTQSAKTYIDKYVDNANDKERADAAKIGISARNSDETARHNRADEELKKDQNSLSRSKNNSDLLRGGSDYLRTQLLDSDAKKANELVPSLIIVRFNVVDDDSSDKNRYIKDFIAGVKARLIPCPAKEIMDHIESVTKNKVSMVNLIRATTKEISFAKDFVAAIDQAKIDAKDDSKLSKTSPIWRSLQARSTKSGLNRLRKNKANDASAITTLVISSELCNLIRNDSSIDLTAPKNAQYVMESYNLMGLVIVDEQTEVAHFLLDGEKYFQDYGFTSLERETGDGSYKKIVNLVSQLNRR